MRSRLDSKLALLSLAALAATACGASNGPLEAPRPPEFAPKDQAKCGVTKSQARPLIVEWPSSDRATLEARLKQGPVPVRYEGCHMEVLAQCKAPGSYAYTGITRKKDTIVMKDADELYANIPVYAAKFEGTLQKTGALSVAMTIVGRYEASNPLVRAADLVGSCDEATHVISAITVGAFEFSAGASREAGASVTAMGAGAGAKTSSERETLSTDGDEAKCASAGPDDKAPPFGCGALLRVEVVPLNATAKGEPSCPGGTAWDGSQCVAKADTSCLAGTHYESGRGCVADVAGSAAASAKSCADAKGCAEQCDKGDFNACNSAAEMYSEGRGTTKDVERGLALSEKACFAGDDKGCVALGEKLYNARGVGKDPGRAAKLFKRACERGEPNGCVDLGWAYTSGSGVPKDGAAAEAAFGKACSDATKVGCIGLGVLYRGGTPGVAKDEKRAAGYFKNACDAGVSMGCKMLKEISP